MVQALAKEAMRLEVPVFNNTTGVRILIAPNPARRATGPADQAPYVINFTLRFGARCLGPHGKSS
jgi:hypothetical protein